MRAARSACCGPDDGMLARWAVAAALRFAPEVRLPALDCGAHQARLGQFNTYGFAAPFNPSHPGAPGNACGGWPHKGASDAATWNGSNP